MLIVYIWICLICKISEGISYFRIYKYIIWVSCLSVAQVCIPIMHKTTQRCKGISITKFSHLLSQETKVNNAIKKMDTIILKKIIIKKKRQQKHQRNFRLPKAFSLIVLDRRLFQNKTSLMVSNFFNFQQKYLWIVICIKCSTSIYQDISKTECCCLFL